MTVAELVAKLSALDPSLEVAVEDDGLFIQADDVRVERVWLRRADYVGDADVNLDAVVIA